MTIQETVAVVEAPSSRIEWGPVIAGAFIAAAVASVLHGFAAALGISLSSSAPTWRDASFALVLLSGLYLLLVAIVSYGAGAYAAARLRIRWGDGIGAFSYSDGMHGIIVWALATLLTGLFLLAVAHLAAPAAAPPGVGAGQATSVAGENIIAFDLDRLFRGDRRLPANEMAYPRSEAARILMTGSSHRGMLAEDRTYLVRLVSAVTGLSAADADWRVNEQAGRARENIKRARAVAAILGFMAASAALVGAVVAWFAGAAGGRHREGLEAVPEFWDWDRPYRRTA